MTIPDWLFQAALIGLFGFFAKRYLDAQDKRYDMVVANLKDFTTAVDQLKEVISSLRTNSALQKTICHEKHKQLDEAIIDIKKKIEHI